jgi:hypothetical protein
VEIGSAVWKSQPKWLKKGTYALIAVENPKKTNKAGMKRDNLLKIGWLMEVFLRQEHGTR